MLVVSSDSSVNEYRLRQTVSANVGDLAMIVDRMFVNQNASFDAALGDPIRAAIACIARSLSAALVSNVSAMIGNIRPVTTDERFST